MLRLDQLGRTVDVPERPKRIVSLVPSQTELLHYLGADEQVVGITKFCVHPDSWHRSKNRVGGTKKVNLGRIRELEPDLIIANKEENTKTDVEELANEFPVWVSDVRDMTSATGMISNIGELVDERNKALDLNIEIATEIKRVSPWTGKPRVLYLIWKDPYMAAGGRTYIDSMLRLAGAQNVILTDRYPELGIEEIADLDPDVVLYSSEPYPFKAAHLEELKAILPKAKHMLVDGEAFSWYGSRIPSALRYISGLLP